MERKNFVKEGLQHFYTDRQKDGKSYALDFDHLFSDELNQFKQECGVSEYQITDIWTIKYKKEDYQTVHNHRSFGYSGLLYVDYDEKVHKPTVFVGPWNDPISDTTQLAFAQFTVKGKVTDAAGNPVVGASITIRNTTLGVAAGATGTFELVADLKKGSYVAQFSSTGYKTLEKSFSVGTTAVIELNVSLVEDAAGLDEVVVTGTSAGTTRKQLGNYIATVKGADLNRAAPSNVLAALS